MLAWFYSVLLGLRMEFGKVDCPSITVNHVGLSLNSSKGIMERLTSNYMEKFFHSRAAQVVSGTIAGFVLGMAMKSAVMAFIGPKLFVALTSGTGLFTILIIVVLALFVGFTLYARATRRFNPQGPRNQ